MKFFVVLFMILMSPGFTTGGTGLDYAKALIGEWLVVKGTDQSKIVRVTFYPNGLINIENRDVKLIQGYRVKTRTSPFTIEVIAGIGNATTVSSFTVDFATPSKINLYCERDTSVLKLVLRKVRDIKSGFIPLVSHYK